MIGNLKIAFRSLAKYPFVSGIAVASLALGIGANAAIFSLFHQMLMQPLPVEDPAALVNLGAPGVKAGSTSCNQAGDCDSVFSYPMFRDLERVQTVFTGMAAHRSFGANLAYGGQTEVAGGMMVSGGYFPVLGLQAVVGRLINTNDDAVVGESAVAVLSHAYWQERFGGDASILNDTLVINGQPMTIIGVAPEGFEGTTLGNQPKVFVPITLREVLEPRWAGAFDNRRNYWVYVFARLNPGIGIDGAAAPLNGQYAAIINEVEAPLQTGMSEETLARFRDKQLRIEPGARGQSGLHAEVGAPLTLLNGVTLLVLLIACANIANLLLGRAVARSGEMAVRLSVGASRRHLIGQLLAESLLLALVGGVAGLVVARWTLSGIASLLPDQAAAMIDPSLSLPVLAFTAVLTTTQIALSMALLVGAGLFIRSLSAVSRIDLGLDAEDVVTFRISPERNGYQPAATRALFERTEDALAALPGITSVSAAMIPLLANSNSSTNLRVEGFEDGPDVDANANYNLIAPDYFRTLGITLLAGREFTRSDVLGAPKVAIVNEEFARKFGLGRDAVGRRMAIGGSDDLDIEIVGLVQDAKYSDVKDEIPPQFFEPYRQSEDIGSISFYARSELDAREQLSAIAPLISRLDPNVPVEHPLTLQMQVEENTFGDRIISTLSTAFAVLATLLGALALGRAAESLLFEVTGHDPVVLIASIGLLGLIALGAGAIPAHRASRVDPMVALRSN